MPWGQRKSSEKYLVNDQPYRADTTLPILDIVENIDQLPNIFFRLSPFFLAQWQDLRKGCGSWFQIPAEIGMKILYAKHLILGFFGVLRGATMTSRKTIFSSFNFNFSPPKKEG